MASIDVPQEQTENVQNTDAGRMFACIALRGGHVIEFECQKINVKKNPFGELREIGWEGGEGPLYVDLEQVAAYYVRRERP